MINCFLDCLFFNVYWASGTCIFQTKPSVLTLPFSVSLSGSQVLGRGRLMSLNSCFPFSRPSSSVMLLLCSTCSHSFYDHFYLTLCVWGGHAHTCGAHLWSEGTVRLPSLFLLSGFLRSNSGHQAWLY